LIILDPGKEEDLFAHSREKNGKGWDKKGSVEWQYN